MTNVVYSEMSVELINHMGDDLTVVNAARVSFDKESKWGDPVNNILFEQDAKLINYLARHEHWTPFAHCFATFRIKMPIFVARQLVRHMVGTALNENMTLNEESRRYVDNPPEFYIPKQWRARPDKSIKQGSGEFVSNSINDEAEAVIDANTEFCLRTYDILLERNIAPEMARMVLPLNTMTQWIWSGSLAAFARVCKQRLDSHAQSETREIAMEVHTHMRALFPVSWTALVTRE